MRKKNKHMGNIIERMKKIFNIKIDLNGAFFITATLVYIYLSIFIFLLGWVKPIISIPICTILCFLIASYIKEKQKRIKEQKQKAMYINIKSIILVGIVIFTIGILYGWTGVFAQPWDWIKHNAVLSDLTNKSWPVYYVNGSEQSMLTYYLGQYLFPSVIGKIFSSVYVAQIANGLWAIIGLFIATLSVFKITKSDSKEKQLISLMIIILFSACVPLAQKLGKIIAPDLIINSGYWIVNTGNIKLQLSSNAVLLRWVMPQVIIPWITLSILIDDPYDIKNYVLLFLPALFYSTLPFIGIIIVLGSLTCIKLVKNKNKVDVIKSIFSIPNICITATLGIIMLLYFYGNILLDKPDSVGINFISYTAHPIIYLVFVLSFIPYSIVLLKNNFRNSFYWIATIILLLLPFVSMGLYNDFVMRVSIVPLFIYMILIIQELYSTKITHFKKIVLIIFLLIGSYYSMSEMENCFALNDTKWESLEIYANRKSASGTEDLKYNYYSYDIKDNLFYKYIARKKIK